MTDTNAPAYAGPQRVFSGIQPTGNLHLGNYLGALKKFVDLQNDGWDCVYSVVDMHAITMPVEKGVLADQTRQITAAYIASGIDPKKSIIFAQSPTTSSKPEMIIFIKSKRTDTRFTP